MLQCTLRAERMASARRAVVCVDAREVEFWALWARERLARAVVNASKREICRGARGAHMGEMQGYIGCRGKGGPLRCLRGAEAAAGA